MTPHAENWQDRFKELELCECEHESGESQTDRLLAFIDQEISRAREEGINE